MAPTVFQLKLRLSKWTVGSGSFGLPPASALLCCTTHLLQPRSTPDSSHTGPCLPSSFVWAALHAEWIPTAFKSLHLAKTPYEVRSHKDPPLVLAQIFLLFPLLSTLLLLRPLQPLSPQHWLPPTTTPPTLPMPWSLQGLCCPLPSHPLLSLSLPSCSS